MSENGSVDAATTEVGDAAAQPAQAGVSDIEQRVLTIVRTTIDGPCELDDELFGLGLTSLDSLNILSQIREEFGVRVRLRDFYQARTTRNLCVLIADVV